jgi:hypothetical protein
MGIVSPAEGDAIVLEGHETMVGDGYAMSVAGQVENMFGAAEGRLGVNDPVLLAKLPEEVAECIRRGKVPRPLLTRVELARQLRRRTLASSEVGRYHNRP